MPRYSRGLGNLLSVLAEEASEIIKEVMKADRFGLDGNPEWLAEGHKSPQANIIQEIADMMLVVDMLVEKGFTTRAELRLLRAQKLEKMIAHYGEAEIANATWQRSVVVSAPPDYIDPSVIVNPDPTEGHYDTQGHWQPDADPKMGRIRMWKHRTGGYIVYEDHPIAVSKRLPIAPWTTGDDYKIPRAC